MTIDKRINYDYVAQDGVKNYVKDSKSVTVPEKFKARKNAPEVKLAYITNAEAKMLKKNKPGTPHKGPKGIPSYDSFDADMNFTSGAAMSAAESGKNTSDTLAAGMTGRDVQDIRSSAIAAGAGQRVNPGFFDSRNTVSRDELARAKALNPAAFRAGRRGGIMDFFTGGGILGNIVRGLGQKFGLGKTYDQPTYDMSGINTRIYEGTMDPTVNPEYYNDLGNELMLSTEASPASGFVTATPIGTNYPGANRFKAPRKRITYGDTPGVPDYLTDEMFEEQFGNFNTIKPTNLNDFEGLYSLPQKEDFLGNTSEDYQISPNSINAYQAKVTQDDIDRSKSRTFKSMDYDTYKMIVPNTQVTPYEFEQLQKGNITEPGTYTV